MEKSSFPIYSLNIEISAHICTGMPGGVHQLSSACVVCPCTEAKQPRLIMHLKQNQNCIAFLMRLQPHIEDCRFYASSFPTTVHSRCNCARYFPLPIERPFSFGWKERVQLWKLLNVIARCAVSVEEDPSKTSRQNDPSKSVRKSASNLGSSHT